MTMRALSSRFAGPANNGFASRAWKADKLEAQDHPAFDWNASPGGGLIPSEHANEESIQIDVP
jgi:hypothetical protein